MNYVLFETGNEKFFSGIVDEFCLVVVQAVIDIYAKITALQQADPVSLDLIQEEFHTDGKLWPPLNCRLFPSVYCGDRKCADNNIVLTSDQLDKFEVSMTHTKQAFFAAKKSAYDARYCLNIQRILQNWKSRISQGLVHIPVRDRQDHDTYLRSYVKLTNKLKHKAEGIVYVCSKTGSDYDYFKTNTKLPNVTACYKYQQVKH